MDETPPKRWWLIATAAIVAVLMLYYYTDSWLIVVLFLAASGALLTFQGRRKQPAHACMRCGAPLNPNARQCDSCGSASWTVRN